jgi:pimeloyl-[acyl-carrier protein] methyl ester esterase
MSNAIIAMHGWGGDSRIWVPWAAAAGARGWSLACGERGYGQLEPVLPGWQEGQRQRVLIGHSLGPHLLPAELWQSATAVVLLASFAAFVPPGPEGRRVAAALRAMEARLEAGEELAQLRDFRARVAHPFPASHLPAGPLEQGLSAAGRERLHHDLQRLATTTGLPAGFPDGVPVLVVEAEDDAIVSAASRALLRQALPQAEVWTLQRAGHALLGHDLVTTVLEWVCDERP